MDKHLSQIVYQDTVTAGAPGLHFTFDECADVIIATSCTGASALVPGARMARSHEFMFPDACNPGGTKQPGCFSQGVG